MAKRRYSPKAKPSVEYVAGTYAGPDIWVVDALWHYDIITTGAAATDIPPESYVFGGYYRRRFYSANIPVIARYALYHKRKGEAVPIALDEAWAERKFMAGELHRYGVFEWFGLGEPEPLYLKFRRTKLSEDETISLAIHPLMANAAVRATTGSKAFFKRL